MEIAAVGNNFMPSKTENAATTGMQSGFQQVLNSVVYNTSPNQRMLSKEDYKTLTAAESLLSFLKSNSIQPLTAEMPAEEIQISELSNSQNDSFQIVKKLLGISDQKWSEVIAELKGNMQGMTGDQDPINVLIEGLAGLNLNQPLASLNENLILFLKAAKVSTLLSDQDVSRQQVLTGLLDSVKNQLQAVVHPSITQTKRTYLQNTFSQLVSNTLDRDISKSLSESFSTLNTNQSAAGSNKQTIPFLKSDKVYGLLSNLDLTGKPLSSGLLEDQIQGAVLNSNKQSKLTYLQNTLSKFGSELNTQTALTSQENRIKNADRLMDWSGNSPILPQMSKPEQIAVMTNGAQKPVLTDDLIKQFESLISKSQFSKEGGVQKLLIKLNPEHLGSIRIELIQKDQLITARILTTTEAAKEALDTHLHNLKHAFEAQNIKVDNVEIRQQPLQSQQEEFLNRGQKDQQQRQQDQRQHKSRDGDTTNDFILTLDEAILDQGV